MRWLVSILVLLLINGSVYAEKTFFYKTYEEKTGQVINETSFQLGAPDSGEILALWKNETDGSTVEQVLDSDYGIQMWKALNPQGDTDFIGERKGKQILIKGKQKGKEIDKRIKIDDKPFFLFPILGLSKFVKSGKESVEFWTLRPDNLSEYKMKANIQGTETIMVNGKEVETIRVKWRLTGLLSKLFSQTFWFRKSDGVFVKSKPSRGAFTELVDENKKETP